LEWAKGRVSSCIDLFGQEGLVSRSKVNLKQELFSRDLWRGPRERVFILHWYIWTRRFFGSMKKYYWSRLCGENLSKGPNLIAAHAIASDFKPTQDLPTSSVVSVGRWICPYQLVGVSGTCTSRNKRITNIDNCTCVGAKFKAWADRLLTKAYKDLEIRQQLQLVIYAFFVYSCRYSLFDSPRRYHATNRDILWHLFRHHPQLLRCHCLDYATFSELHTTVISKLQTASKYIIGFIIYKSEYSIRGRRHLGEFLTRGPLRL
jgi:hypothetical protein